MGNPPFAVWAQEHPSVRLGTFSEAAEHGEALILACNGHAAHDVLTGAGAEALGDKVLLDVTNPLDFSQGFPPTLFVSNDDSLGEQLQRAFPRLRVVKTLNTMNAGLMVAPHSLADGDHSVFVSGDDDQARAQVVLWLREWFGWRMSSTWATSPRHGVRSRCCRSGFGSWAPWSHRRSSSRSCADWRASHPAALTARQTRQRRTALPEGRAVPRRGQLG